jgi:hypothetical protein
MLDDDRSFFYSGAYGFLTRTVSTDVSSFNCHNLPTDPRVSVTMGRSKGLAESTEVYPVENLFPRIILLVLALLGPAYFYIARDYCKTRSWDLTWSLIY